MARLETRYRLKAPRDAVVHFTITANAGELSVLADWMEENVGRGDPWAVRETRDQLGKAVDQADRTFFDLAGKPAKEDEAEKVEGETDED